MRFQNNTDKSMKHQCAIPRAIPRGLGVAGLLLALLAGIGTASAANLTFAPGRVTAPTSTQVVLPVVVTNFSSVSLFQFSVHWNPETASYVGVEQFGLAGMGAANFGTTLSAGGTLTVSWDDPNGLSSTVTNGATIFGIRLQLQGAPGSSSTVTIDGIPTPIEAADQDLVPVPVSVLSGAVSINPPDMAPQILTHPQSQTVLQNGSVTFSVAATGTAPLSYQWRHGTTELAGQNSTNLTLFNVQASQAGGYSVLVSNGAGSITSQVATLVVQAPNTPPILGAIGNRAVNEMNLLSFTVSAVDNDSPAQTLTYSFDPDPPVGLTIHPTTGLVTWTPQESQGPSTNTVTIRVTDNGTPALSDSETITIIVHEVNAPPSISLVADKMVNEGNLLTFIVTANDPDVPSRPLTFALDPGAPSNAVINPVTGQFTWTPTEEQGPSLVSVTVRVTDGGVPALSDTVAFSIMVNEVNSAPVLPSPGNRLVAEGSLLTFSARATDSDVPVQTLFYTLDPGAPIGALVDAVTGTFSWTPGEAQGPGTNVVTIRVSDNGVPQLSDFKTFVIVVTEVNTPPTLGMMEDKVVVEGGTVTAVASGMDGDMPAQTLTYSLAAGAPAGASIHPVTGIFTWNTGESNGPSTNRISVVVRDSGDVSMSATQSFTVLVLENNQPPSLQPIPNLTAQVLVPLRVTNVVMDPDIPSNHITFQFLEAPKGARMNRFTGAIFWAPTRDQARSTNVFTVLAIDDGAPPLIATNTFYVTVDDFMEMMLGSAVLRSGQTGTVPVQIVSTVGLTNVESMLVTPENRLADLSLLTVAAQLQPASLQMQGPGTARLGFHTQPGQSLMSSQLVAHLQFTAVSTQSAFVPLILHSLTANQSNGVAVARTIPGAGRVVVIAEEPLLEAQVFTNSQRQLVLYGPPGPGYVVQKSTEPASPAAWQTAWEGSLTNLYQVIPATGGGSIFYRAIRP